ncbi:MAG: hypothetical protein RSE12_08870 [Fuscovulum sp.]|nr:MAG: hypothetical protein RSE12_08870 [Fuscovulum sp.]
MTDPLLAASDEVGFARDLCDLIAESGHAGAAAAALHASDRLAKALQLIRVAMADNTKGGA